MSGYHLFYPFRAVCLFVVFCLTAFLLSTQSVAAFTDVTVSSGILFDAAVSLDGTGGGASGAAWGDYDNDGDEDLYVTREVGAISGLYKNNGNGVFENVTDIAKVGINEAWGAAWGDYDNDNDLDLYVGRSMTQPNILYRNNGNGTFTDMGADLGVEGPFDVQSGEIGKPSRTISWSDYDRDGWLDIYAASRALKDGDGLPSLLYHNIPDGTGGRKFEEVAFSMNLDGGKALKFTGLWSDYDNDGDPDLFMANDFHGLELFQNPGDGSSFTRVTVTAFPGQLVDTLGAMLPHAVTLFSGCSESSDGHPIDLAQLPAHVHCIPDAPDLGFTPENPTYGALPHAAMGICMGDYNNDGFMDYYVTNVTADDGVESYAKPESALWHNNGPDGTGNVTFTERAREARINILKDNDPANEERDSTGFYLKSIGEHEATEWGCNFFDYDNDGNLDLYVVSGPPEAFAPSYSLRDRLYRNNGDETFTNVTENEIPIGSGTGLDGEASGLGSAVADMDDDGDLDLFVANKNVGSSHLYRNDLPLGNNWLKVKLVGAGQRFAVGARLQVTSQGVTRLRDVTAGSGYLSMDSLIQHIGLGPATMVDEIQVQWPDGLVSTVLNYPANQTLVMDEGCVSPGMADTTPPSLVTGLTAVADGAGQVDLSWDASIDDVCVLEYRIYLKTGLVGSSPTSSYQHTGLAENTEYCYKVTAVDTSGNEPDLGKQQTCVTTLLDTTPPSPPMNFTASAKGAFQTELTWTLASDDVGVVGYQLFRGMEQVATPTAPPYDDTVPTTEIEYCYTLRAVDGVGNLSDSSNESCAMPRDTAPPTAPVELVASVVRSGEVDLKWERSSDDVNVVNYQVYRNGALVGTPIEPYFTDTNLDVVTQYTYVVYALDAAGNVSVSSVSVPIVPVEIVPVKVGFVGAEAGPCFIATAAFGSPMESHVRLLRNFRDRFLLISPFGRSVVRLYERFSPPLAKVIAQDEGLRALVRFMLWPVIGLAWWLLTATMAMNLGVMLLGFVMVGWAVGRLRRGRPFNKLKVT